MTEPDETPAPGACLPLHRAEMIAAGLPPEPDERDHLARCAACREEIERIEDDNALLGAAAAASSETDPGEALASDAPPGYRFIEEIHRGAQGVVYLAEQDRTNRRVAVKLTLRGAFASARQRARFDREVELAASINHPSVVTVYESGATPSGGRYMAMEHVEGLPLSRWFGTRGRDPRAVAALLADLASAVAAAHRKGVIHRDLKPSNILVAAGDRPVLVDFGIAKGVLGDASPGAASETLAGEFVGTLAYAAPEQVSGEPDAVDTRADVYALGALLYEGLAGRRPLELDGGLAECVRAIQDEPPRPPGAHASTVPADLDTVALRALEKRPEDRYQSAADLEDDLRRYLAGDAVSTRSHETIYRLRKWARRRRKRLAVAAIALLALAVTAGFAGRAYFASIEAKIARGERAYTVEALLRPLEAADTELSNEAVTSLNDYLILMAGALAKELPDSPELEAAIRSRVGIALTAENEFDEARLQLERALSLWKKAAGDRSPEAAEARHNLARLHWKRGDYESARPLYTKALETRREVLPEGDLETARTAHHLASTLQRLGEFEAAVALYQEALDARTAALGPDDPAVANTLNGLGECYTDQRRFDEAIERYRECRRIITAAAGERDWRTASVAANEARALIALGRAGEARPLLERALEINREWWREDDTRVLRVRLALARIDKDEPALAALAAKLETALGPDHVIVAGARSALAEERLTRGDWAGALGAAERAERSLAPRGADWPLAHALIIKSEALARLGRADESDHAAQRAREILSACDLPERDPLRARAGLTS